MRALAAALAAVLLLAAPARAQEPLSDRIVRYRIAATLDPEAHTVAGGVTLSIRNTTTRPMADVALHLYANAFADADTRFMRQLARDVPEALELIEASDRWGRIDLVELRTPDGTDLLVPGHVDGTVFRAPLPTPVAPGETLTLHARFTLHVPKGIARLGHTGHHYMIAQWFPKFGRFLEDGWHCKPYVLASEFYSDFGVYDVSITVPVGYVVGATGLQAEERENGGGTKTLRFEAADVHDFAWTASPDYAERVVEQDGVRIRLLYLPWHAPLTDRVLDAAEIAVDRFGRWFGAYPYPQLTIVDAPLQTTGMEYPMLVTTGGLHWLEMPWTHAPEFVTVHEIGHQWWYGLVATDETSYAWMDEGVNTYWTGVVLDAMFGPQTSAVDVGPIAIGEKDYRRQRYAQLPARDSIDTAPADFHSLRSYVRMAYSKPGLAFDTLAGREPGRVAAAFGTYARRYRFRHPGPDALERVFAEEIPDDLTWFWRDVIRGTGTIDYLAARCSYRELDDEPDTYHSLVEVHRRGELAIPVDIRIVFSDGSEKRTTWDGQGHWWRRTYDRAAHVTLVQVDPEERIALDLQPLNNTRLAETDYAAATGLQVWIALAGVWLAHALSVLG